MVTVTEQTIHVDPSIDYPDCVAMRVSGDYACFTRPDLAIERVSYPVITPTAAVGLAEAIYWHPEMRYAVAAIDMLRPVSWMRIVRNEIKSRQTCDGAAKWPGINTDRAQRHSLILRDVEYVVYLRVTGQEPPLKYKSILQRRLERGQCFYGPYLGCREFLADVEPAEEYDRLDLDIELGRVVTTLGRGDQWQATQRSLLAIRNGRLEIDNADR